MSLLMKALEKAAKDREETDAERVVAAPAAPAVARAAAKAPPDLALEPIAPPVAAHYEPPQSPRRQSAAASPTPGAASRESAQAATVIRAGRRDPGGGVGAYVREHPLIVFGTFAALFSLGYGTYIYLQLTNPGMFVKQPPRPAQQTPSAPIAPAQVPLPSSGTTAAAAGQLPIPFAPQLAMLQTGADKEEKQPQVAVPPPVAVAPPVAAAPPPVPERPPIRDTIKVTAGGATPVVNPLLAEGYTALTTGDLESSQRLYHQLLRGEPGNTDALLGLAAIATQQNDRDAAAKYYLRALEADPRNAPAQAGLIGMLGSADPQGAESRLKQLIARDPSGYLYFALGNTYIDQKRWPEAQQAFFQSHHLQPDNPEYAYNLAVALEHIGQPKPALDYYRRAAQLAAAKGRVNFSTAAVQERISKLEKVAR